MTTKKKKPVKEKIPAELKGLLNERKKAEVVYLRTEQKINSFYSDHFVKNNKEKINSRRPILLFNDSDKNFVVFVPYKILNQKPRGYRIEGTFVELDAKSVSVNSGILSLGKNSLSFTFPEMKEMNRLLLLINEKFIQLSKMDKGQEKNYRDFISKLLSITV